MLAQRLLAIDGVATAEVAGPGFINLRLTDAFWHMRLIERLRRASLWRIRHRRGVAGEH